MDTLFIDKNIKLLIYLVFLILTISGCMEESDNENVSEIETEQIIGWFGTERTDVSGGLSIDKQDNFVVVGSTYGQIEGFLNTGSSSDIILGKFNSDGDMLWEKQIGSNETDQGIGIAADSESNIYITGFTDGNLDGNSHKGTDALLLKYDSSGEKLWSRTIGTNNYEIGWQLAIDQWSNVFLTGFVSHSGHETDDYWNSCANYGDKDIFVTKFDSSGDQKWVNLLCVKKADMYSYLSIDNSGSIYIAGTVHGDYYRMYDVFIAKYNSNGDKLWIRYLGSKSSQQAKGISAGINGDVYLVGNIANYFYLLKMDSSGEIQWTQEISSSSIVKAVDIDIDSNGNIYILGHTWGDLHGIQNNGEVDILLMKFNTSGERQWTKLTGGNGIDFIDELSLNNQGQVFLLGEKSGLIEPKNGYSDIYFMKPDS